MTDSAETPGAEPSGGESAGGEPAGMAPARRRRTRPRAKAAPEPAAEPVRPTQTKAERDAERGLRGLVGAGPSQVNPDAAMRARDASQPTAEDLARAEKDTVIVRRHYVPSEAPPFEPR